MTSKLNYIIGCCSVFNCTHSVVLSALAAPVKKNDIHAKTKAAIRKQATKVTNYTLAEWKKAVAAFEPRHSALYRLTLGCTVTPLPLP